LVDALPVAESLNTFHDGAATLAAMQLSRTKGAARAFAKTK
jgi:hypothetical protein